MPQPSRTSQGLEIIDPRRVTFCPYCSELKHYGVCAEMRAEQRRAQQNNEGRPVPITRSGPIAPISEITLVLPDAEKFSVTGKTHFSSLEDYCRHDVEMTRSFQEELDRHIGRWWVEKYARGL